MPRIDDPAGSLPGLAVVDVDVSGLDRFAGSVEGELQANFHPQSVDLMKIYSAGPRFGVGHVSTDVMAARLRYTECLQAAVNQLAAYADATQILVEAARTVAARYRDTDALAESNMLEVRQALDAAVRAAARAQYPTTNTGRHAGSEGQVGI